MKKINYKKILKQFIALFKRKPFDISHSPESDWKWLLIFFIFANIISATLNFYMFQRINRGDIFTVEEDMSTQVDTIDRKGLLEVIQYFEEQKERLNNLAEEKTQVVDPSL